MKKLLLGTLCLFAVVGLLLTIGRVFDKNKDHITPAPSVTTAKTPLSPGGEATDPTETDPVTPNPGGETTEPSETEPSETEPDPSPADLLSGTVTSDGSLKLNRAAVANANLQVGSFVKVGTEEGGADVLEVGCIVSFDGDQRDISGSIDTTVTVQMFWTSRPDNGGQTLYENDSENTMFTSSSQLLYSGIIYVTPLQLESLADATPEPLENGGEQQTINVTAGEIYLVVIRCSEVSGQDLILTQNTSSASGYAEIDSNNQFLSSGQLTFIRYAVENASSLTASTSYSDVSFTFYHILNPN